MTANLRIDTCSEREASDALHTCCGASRWVRAMCDRRPFGSVEALLAAADEEWGRMGRADVLEAFEHHPRIGGDLDALRQRFSAAEQAGVEAADEAVLTALRDGNRRYEERFGHIFIVCATGKRADEMLAILESRLGNEPDRELQIAAAEQAAITRLRLLRLVGC